jgi:tyrosinase
MSSDRVRLAIWNYETVLRDECGYKGAQPYWDYTLDTPERGGHFKTSPVFDPKYGFGGDGSLTPSPDNKNGNSPKGAKAAKGVKCADGPFAKYKINLGPGNSMKANPRCLTRQINGPMAEAAAKPENLAAIMRESTFEQFQQLRARNAGNFNLASPNSFVVGFHTIGHQGIGGEVSSVS